MALTTKMAFVIGELWDTLEEAKLGPQSPWLVPQSAQDMGFPTSHLQGPTDEVGLIQFGARQRHKVLFLGSFQAKKTCKSKALKPCCSSPSRNILRQRLSGVACSTGWKHDKGPFWTKRAQQKHLGVWW